MRRYSDILEYRACLCGSLSYSLTALGAPIDTRGFKDVMATLIVGAVTAGTNTNKGILTVKFQEATSPTGTGATWADITDGAINGSFKFSDYAVWGGTNSTIQQGLLYERLADSNRKRYIRAHATLDGTTPVNVRFAVGVLLGRPQDTTYITGATSIDTGNLQFSLCL